jgi:RNA polymerase sigma factor (sigma-70 family)
MEFKNYAYRRMMGACCDAAREALPQGFRRNKGAAPLVGNYDVGDEGGTLLDFVPSPAHAVGWELESIDEVRGLLRTLPADERRATQLYYQQAGANMRVIGEMMGLHESRISQLTTSALKRLRQEARK